jgi:hypothetical protein
MPVSIEMGTSISDTGAIQIPIDGTVRRTGRNDSALRSGQTTDSSRGVERVPMNVNIVVARAMVVALANPRAGAAAEIKIFTTRAIATVLAEIGGEFERATGHTLIVVSDLPTGFLRSRSSKDHAQSL